ncbi:histidine kinase-like protein [Kineococcus xinjiangensis]|uniref:Histidine kinase-like protein n=1 Tax=Kineococcus xinjiangensis TaxID=512762 RepID=A0A2S6IC63_9ACTN|nr:ATP-binding protein [Kineococcus xinjiangensis]PPK90804.1 histidine kinase-like protein [Kineococcus xinjiangensis]
MSQVRDGAVVLGHDLGSVSRARHWAAARCAELTADLTPEQRTDLRRLVELVATELVANAVEHGRPPLRLAVERLGGDVRVRVEDGEPALPVRRDSPADATSGRGIALVEHLSRRWGAERGAGGKVVWCDLPVDGPFPL